MLNHDVLIQYRRLTNLVAKEALYPKIKEFRNRIMSVLFDIGKTNFFLKPLFISTPTLKFLSGNSTVLNVLLNLTCTSKTSKCYILRYKALCRIAENARVGDGDGRHLCFVKNMLLGIFCFEEIIFPPTWYDEINLYRTKVTFAVTQVKV
jgi:hypothetical protein